MSIVKCEKVYLFHCSSHDTPNEPVALLHVSLLIASSSSFCNLVILRWSLVQAFYVQSRVALFPYNVVRGLRHATLLPNCLLLHAGSFILPVCLQNRYFQYFFYAYSIVCMYTLSLCEKRAIRNWDLGFQNNQETPIQKKAKIVEK